MSWIEKGWYGYHRQTFFLLPLTIIFYLLSQTRRLLYRLGLLKRCTSSTPVVVVGNITVGGTGKTPFVLYLIECLKSQGYRPAIVSRGFGAKQDGAPFPRLITPESDVAYAGDEPKLLAMRSGCPVVIAPKRCEAVQFVQRNTQADIIVSDDGLQHYAMDRCIEIVLVDAKRKFGNGWLLPVGPLREPVSRLKSADLVIENHGFQREGEYRLQARSIYNLIEPQERLETSSETEVHLVSGIGNPGRFVDTVEGLNLKIASTTWFPDHHPFSEEDFRRFQDRDEDIILMTEKDAVKCADFARANWYVLPISAELSETLENRLLDIINQKCTAFN